MFFKFIYARNVFTYYKCICHILIKITDYNDKTLILTYFTISSRRLHNEAGWQFGMPRPPISANHLHISFIIFCYLRLLLQIINSHSLWLCF